MPRTLPERRPDAAQTAPGRGAEDRAPARVWWRAYRHHLRLLRNASIAWIAALTGISTGVVVTFEDRYSTEAELAALAELEGIPAFEALVGRYVQVATVEGLTLSRWGMFGILVAVWALLAATRLLRGAEEAGHVEPLRAGALAPRGLLTSALAALFTVYAIFAVALGVTHTAVGMDAATSWALGGAVALLAATFAAAAALASQLVATRRRAVGIVGTFLGVSLGVRVLAAATATPDWLWWVTPFGWMGFLNEIDAARPAVFGAFTVLVVVLVAAVFATARRDLHAGVLVGGEARVTGARPLGGQAGLALHLTAAPLRTWGLIVVLVALVFGLLARDFGAAMAEMPTTLELTAQLGWVGLDTPEGIVAWTFSLVALLFAVFAAGQAAAIREEEASWRIEHLLVRPLGRVRWLLTRTAVAAGALVVLAAAGGVAAWLGTALVGTPIAFGDGLLAGLNVLPVAWLFLGLGVAVLGLVPRVTAPAVYGLVVAAYLIDFVGGFLDLPDAVMDASPFRHLAFVPAVDIDVGSALVMLAVGLLGLAAGVLAFRRRDLQEA